MTQRRRESNRRSYRPSVEGLETLRLLANAGPALADILQSTAFPIDSTPVSGAVWDQALVGSRVSELLSNTSASYDSASLQSGLSQLDRYLSRAWYRSGIDPQKHDDCTQAVYTTLLQNLGRDKFDGMLSDVGQKGIREILSRESVEGPDFFRIVDAVKKRAQRERVHQPIDRVDVAAPGVSPNDVNDHRGALQEAISRSLSTREAALIQATLQGRTPAEIAQNWGVAPKTVSNEKAKALQKLRDVLTAQPVD